MTKDEYLAFLEDKIIDYDLELQRIIKVYDKLEVRTDKLQKELIETRWQLNEAKTLSDKHQDK